MARSAASPSTRCSDARRLVPASVSESVPASNSNSASVLRVFLPSQCRRPAIMRCSTRYRSPSSPMTIRLPRRLKPGTRFPSALAIGGTAVRSRNGLSRRTLSQARALNALRQRFEVDRDVGQLGHETARLVGRIPMIRSTRMSLLQTRLRGGEFVVTAEITPPVSTDPAEFLRRAMPLKGLATAVNVTDGAGAKVHLSSLAAAHFLVQSGIEPIFQMTCRDRNRLALQGDLLGAAALGIHNILVLAGDDPKAGDQPEAKAVFDLDSRGLLAMAHRMRARAEAAFGHRDRGQPRAGARRGRRAGRSAARLGPEGPVRQGRGRRGLRADAVLHGHRRRAPLCGAAARARLQAADPDRRRADSLGALGALDAREAVRHPRSRTRSSSAWRKRANPKAEGRRICVEVLQELAEIPGVAGAHVMAPMNFAEIPAAIEESGVLARSARSHDFQRDLRRGRRLQDASAARRQGRAAALPARRERRAGDHALHGKAGAALRRAGARASRATASRTSPSGSRTSTTSPTSISISSSSST